MLKTKKEVEDRECSEEFNAISRKIKDKFIFIYLIAVGGFSCVYKIRKKKKEKFYALKNIKFSANVFNYEKKVLLNLREIECLKKLKNHPNIVSIHDCWLEVDKTLAKSKKKKKKKKNIIITFSGHKKKNKKIKKEEISLSEDHNKLDKDRCYKFELPKGRGVKKEKQNYTTKKIIDKNIHHLEYAEGENSLNDVCKVEGNTKNLPEQLIKKKNIAKNIFGVYYYGSYAFKKKNFLIKSCNGSVKKCPHLRANYLQDEISTKRKNLSPPIYYLHSNINNFERNTPWGEDYLGQFFPYPSSVSTQVAVQKKTNKKWGLPECIPNKKKNKSGKTCIHVNNFIDHLFRDTYGCSSVLRLDVRTVRAFKRGNGELRREIRIEIRIKIRGKVSNEVRAKVGGKSTRKRKGNGNFCGKRQTREQPRWEANGNSYDEGKKNFLRGVKVMSKKKKIDPRGGKCSVKPNERVTSGDGIMPMFRNQGESAKNSHTNTSNKIICKKNKYRNIIIFLTKRHIRVYKIVAYSIYFNGVYDLEKMKEVRNVIHSYFLKNYRLNYLNCNTFKRNYVKLCRYLEDCRYNNHYFPFLICYRMTQFTENMKRGEDMSLCRMIPHLTGMKKRDESRGEKITKLEMTESCKYWRQRRNKEKSIPYPPPVNYYVQVLCKNITFERAKKKGKVASNRFASKLCAEFVFLFFKKKRKEITNSLKILKLLQHLMNAHKLCNYCRSRRIKMRRRIFTHIKCFLLRNVFFLVLKNIEISMGVSFPGLFAQKKKKIFLVNTNYHNRLMKIYVLMLYKIGSSKSHVSNQSKGKIFTILRNMETIYDQVRISCANPSQKENLKHFRRGSMISELLLRDRLKCRKRINPTALKKDNKMICSELMRRKRDSEPFQKGMPIGLCHHSHFDIKTEDDITKTQQGTFSPYHLNGRYNLEGEMNSFIQGHLKAGITSDALKMQNGDEHTLHSRKMHAVVPICCRSNKYEKCRRVNPGVVEKSHSNSRISRRSQSSLSTGCGHHLIHHEKFIKFKHTDTYFVHELKNIINENVVKKRKMPYHKIDLCYNNYYFNNLFNCRSGKITLTKKQLINIIFYNGREQKKRRTLLTLMKKFSTQILTSQNTVSRMHSRGLVCKTAISKTEEPLEEKKIPNRRRCGRCENKGVDKKRHIRSANKYTHRTTVSNKTVNPLGEGSNSVIKRSGRIRSAQRRSRVEEGIRPPQLVYYYYNFADVFVFIFLYELCGDETNAGHGLTKVLKMVEGEAQFWFHLKNHLLWEKKKRKKKTGFLRRSRKINYHLWRICTSIMLKSKEEDMCYSSSCCNRLRTFLFFSEKVRKKYFHGMLFIAVLGAVYTHVTVSAHLLEIKRGENVFGNGFFLTLYIAHRVEAVVVEVLTEALVEFLGTAARVTVGKMGNAFPLGIMAKPYYGHCRRRNIESGTFAKKRLFYQYLITSLSMVTATHFYDEKEYSEYKKMVQVVEAGLSRYSVYTAMYIICNIKIFRSFYSFEKGFKGQLLRSWERKMCERHARCCDTSGGAHELSRIHQQSRVHLSFTPARCYSIFVLRLCTMLKNRIRGLEAGMIKMLSFVEEKYLNKLERGNSTRFHHFFRKNLYHFMRDKNFLKDRGGDLFEVSASMNSKNDTTIFMKEINNFFFFDVHLHNYFEMMKAINRIGIGNHTGVIDYQGENHLYSKIDTIGDRYFPGYNILSKDRLTTFHCKVFVTSVVDFLDSWHLLTNVKKRRVRRVVALTSEQEATINNLFVSNFCNFCIYFFYFQKKMKKSKMMNNHVKREPLKLLIDIDPIRETSNVILFKITSVCSTIFSDIMERERTNVYRYIGIRKLKNHLHIYRYNAFIEYFGKSETTASLLFQHIPLIFDTRIYIQISKEGNYMKRISPLKRQKIVFVHGNVSILFPSHENYKMVKKLKLFKMNKLTEKLHILRKKRNTLEKKHYVNDIVKMFIGTFSCFPRRYIFYKRKYKFIILCIVGSGNNFFHDFTILCKNIPYRGNDICFCYTSCSEEGKKKSIPMKNCNSAKRSLFRGCIHDVNTQMQISKLVRNTQNDASVKTEKKNAPLANMYSKEMVRSERICIFTKTKRKKQESFSNNRKLNRKKVRSFQNEKKNKRNKKMRNECIDFEEGWNIEKMKKRQFYDFFEQIEYSSENEDFKIIFENSSNGGEINKRGDIERRHGARHTSDTRDARSGTSAKGGYGKHGQHGRHGRHGTRGGRVVENRKLMKIRAIRKKYKHREKNKRGQKPLEREIKLLFGHHYLPIEWGRRNRSISGVMYCTCVCFLSSKEIGDKKILEKPSYASRSTCCANCSRRSIIEKNCHTGDNTLLCCKWKVYERKELSKYKNDILCKDDNKMDIHSSECLKSLSETGELTKGWLFTQIQCIKKSRENFSRRHHCFYVSFLGNETGKMFMRKVNCCALRDGAVTEKLFEMHLNGEHFRESKCSSGEITSEQVNGNDRMYRRDVDYGENNGRSKYEELYLGAKERIVQTMQHMKCDIGRSLQYEGNKKKSNTTDEFTFTKKIKSSNRAHSRIRNKKGKLSQWEKLHQRDLVKCGKRSTQRRIIRKICQIRTPFSCKSNEVKGGEVFFRSILSHSNSNRKGRRKGFGEKNSGESNSDGKVKNRSTDDYHLGIRSDCASDYYNESDMVEKLTHLYSESLFEIGEYNALEDIFFQKTLSLDTCVHEGNVLVDRGVVMPDELGIGRTSLQMVFLNHFINVLSRFFNKEEIGKAEESYCPKLPTHGYPLSCCSFIESAHNSSHVGKIYTDEESSSKMKEAFRKFTRGRDFLTSQFAKGGSLNNFNETILYRPLIEHNIYYVFIARCKGVMEEALPRIYDAHNSVHVEWKQIGQVITSLAKRMLGKKKKNLQKTISKKGMVRRKNVHRENPSLEKLCNKGNQRNGESRIGKKQVICSKYVYDVVSKKHQKRLCTHKLGIRDSMIPSFRLRNGAASWEVLQTLEKKTVKKKKKNGNDGCNGIGSYGRSYNSEAVVRRGYCERKFLPFRGTFATYHHFVKRIMVCYKLQTCRTFLFRNFCSFGGSLHYVIGNRQGEIENRDSSHSSYVLMPNGGSISFVKKGEVDDAKNGREAINGVITQHVVTKMGSCIPERSKSQISGSRESHTSANKEGLSRSGCFEDTNSLIMKRRNIVHRDGRSSLNRSCNSGQYRYDNMNLSSVKINRSNNKHKFVQKERYKFNLYIRMEYCNNTLENYINRRAHININRNKEIIHMLIIGLHYIHQNNIMHRDLKPSNIFICDNNIVKIGDFGLASYDGSGKKKKETKIWKEHTWNKNKSLRCSEQHEHCHVVVKDITSERNTHNGSVKRKVDSYRGNIHNGKLLGDVRRGDIYRITKRKVRKSGQFGFNTLMNGKKLRRKENDVYFAREKGQVPYHNGSKDIWEKLTIHCEKKKKHEYRYASSSSFEKCDRKESDSHQIGDSLISETFNKEKNGSDEAEYPTRVFTKSASIQPMRYYVHKGEIGPNRDLRLEDVASVVGEANSSKAHSLFVHSEDSCWEGSDSEAYKPCSDGGESKTGASEGRRGSSGSSDSSGSSSSSSSTKTTRQNAYCCAAIVKQFLSNSFRKGRSREREGVYENTKKDNRMGKKNNRGNARGSAKMITSRKMFPNLGNGNLDEMLLNMHTNKKKEKKKKKNGNYGYGRKDTPKVSPTPPTSTIWTSDNFRGQRESSYHTLGIGTRMYSAPEQLTGNKYTKAVDMFSLGLIIVDLFTRTETNMERTKILTNARKRILPDLLIKKYPSVAKLCKNLLSLDYNTRFTSEDLYNRMLSVGNVFSPGK
ncbi:serine/threonine protein kinase, putative [Plasmodium ovale]|uniref:non-specific serine/threonine protein kinase n=1 Tax=Plasmodium ovale TaxID=36330 RepID=A0A1D3KWS1_PLAOA|nr:serine/threonine protein kinase, putative [Plasmodium ovale]